MGDLFKDKVVLVTGSGQGVGRAIALAFAEEGAKVVTNNRKPGSTKYIRMTQADYDALPPEKQKEFDETYAVVGGDAESTAKTIIDAGGQALPIYADISDRDQVAALAKEIEDKWGGVDILVNVAGAFGGGAITSISEEQFDEVYSIKPKGYFNVIQAVIPHMQAQKWGRIVNCTSKAMMGDVVKMSDYCAANAAAVGLTQAVACEFYADGITCNAFSPFAMTRGGYESKFVDVGPHTGDKLIPGMPAFGGGAGPAPEPSATAPIVLWLCLDEAADVTGTVFGCYGPEISIHQYPIRTKAIYSDSKWTIDDCHRQASRCFWKGYQNVVEAQ